MEVLFWRIPSVISVSNVSLIHSWIHGLVKIEMGAVQEEFYTTNAISYADLMVSVLSARLQKQISAKLFLGI